MDTLNNKQAERNALRLQLFREELVETIGQAIRDDGVTQPLAGVHLGRLSAPMDKV